MYQIRVRYLIVAALLLAGIVALAGGAGAVSAAPAGQTEEPVGDTDALESRVDNAFCNADGAEHPLAAVLADSYDVTPEEVMTWFCAGYGFGEIALALQTAAIVEATPSDLFENREEQGWGRIWQSFDLIGRPDDDDPVDEAEVDEPDDEDEVDEPGDEDEFDEPDDEDEVDEPDDEDEVDEPDDEAEVEDSGPPEWAGPPDHAGPPAWAGPPDHAGPPDDADTSADDEVEADDTDVDEVDDEEEADHAGPPEGKGPPDHAGGKGGKGGKD